MAAKYIVLLNDFLRGTLSASEFESQFLHTFKNNDEHLSEESYEALNTLFYFVDMLVLDPPLLDKDLGDIDEMELRRECQNTRDTLLRLHPRS